MPETRSHYQRQPGKKRICHKGIAIRNVSINLQPIKKWIMVITAQQRNSKALPSPDENTRMPGFVALSCTPVNQQHPTAAAHAKTCASRIPGAVSFPSGQCHYPVKNDRFMRMFTSYSQW
jgi:hypothetical protein